MPYLLKITDGTTTVDFIASTSGYSLSSWNPAVAKRRRNMMGGAGPYEDVDEEMEITIHGTDALTKLSSLQVLMEQAQRWYRGEPVSAVLLKYKPESTSSELQAAIIGDVDREMVELPRNFPDAPVYDYIDPVVLRFRRRGQWLKDAVVSTTSATFQPAVQAISTTSVDFESPLWLKINGTAPMTYMVPSSIILVSSGATTTQASGRIALIDGGAGTTSGVFTTATDGTLPMGGMLRYTCSTATSQQLYTAWVLPTLDTSVTRWGLYLNYRNNSTAGSFDLDFVFSGATFPTFRIPAGTSDPTWAYLGSVTPSITFSSFALYAGGSLNAATLDIDSVVLHAQDKTTDHTVVINGEISVWQTDDHLNINPRPITKPMPRVYTSQTDTELADMAFSGDAYLTMRGAAVAAVWLGGKHYQYPQYWRPVNNTGSVFQSTLTFSIMEGLVTPK